MRNLAKLNLTLAIAAMVACAASPAPAQDAAPPSAPSRYSFNRVDDGFLRLDNTSGQVAFCSPHTIGWACVVVPEDRAALETEIARLQDEVAQLKQQVANLHEPAPPRPPAELTPRDKSNNPGDNSAQLHENIARARVAIQHAWHRLVEMIVTLQKDMMRKG
jgi:cell division protein FtsB